MSEFVWHPIKRIAGNLWPLPDWDDANDDDCVLVTLRNGLVRSVRLVEGDEEGEGYRFDDVEAEEVKAWARYPEPYEEQRS